MTAYRLIEDRAERTFALIVSARDDALQAVERLAAAERLRSSRLQAVGAFSSVTIAYFDPDTKEYSEQEVDEQIEILSFLGDITDDGSGGAKVHAHVVLGRRDGSAIGGHLMAGTVWPTCEIFVTESPPHLRRAHDPESGLALIDTKEGEWNTLASDAG